MSAAASAGSHHHQDSAYPGLPERFARCTHQDAFSTVIAGSETPHSTSQIRNILRIDDAGGGACRGFPGSYAAVQLPSYGSHDLQSTSSPFPRYQKLRRTVFDWYISGGKGSSHTLFSFGGPGCLGIIYYKKSTKCRSI